MKRLKDCAGQYTILVVDDSTRFRKAIVGMMQAEPRCLNIGEAANGLEALEQARQLSPSLILMDIRMPMMNGLDAMAALRSENPDHNIVLMSMELDPDMRKHALELGAIACLLKGNELWSRLPTILSTLFTRSGSTQPG